ncbi:zinc phosphodiesterase elac protein [Anaeramoeba flamelloides]|uniref:ribonuclease Z n=1 Tax=Anaeramoeba flamelloides TaxID=1746091 RepID=A0AAV7YLR6_9EUKA|nr:zinc phosphodiesterase elac protein [Anaeramoeba flamelloides]
MFAQIVGDYNGINFPSILLCIKNKRYLFNCGEGTFRLSQENKLHFSDLTNIFLTRNEKETISGIGNYMCSTSLLSQKPIQYSLTGPRHSSSLLMLLGYVTHHVKIKLLVKEQWEDSEDVIDGLFNLKTIVLKEEMEEEEEKENVELLLDLSKPKQLRNDFELLPEIKNVKKTSISYIITLPNAKNKFSFQKAKNLGVTDQKDIQKISKGETIKLKNGQTITRKDVFEGTFEDTTIVFLDIPNKKILNDLLNNKTFKEYQTNENLKINYIFYWLNDQIIADKHFQKWIKKFETNTYHLFLRKKQPFLRPTEFCFRTSIETLRILNMLNYDMYPFTFQPNKKNIQKSLEKQEQFKKKFLPKNSVFLQDQLIIRFDQTNEEKIIDESLLTIIKRNNERERNAISGIINKMETFKEKFSIKNKKLIPKNTNLDQQYKLEELFNEIVFLGTNGAVQSRYKNMSGILLKMTSNFNILLDCGEGTYGQLLTLFGSKIGKILLNIKFIWISHNHSDHSFGLIKLLRMREYYYKLKFKNYNEYKQPLIIGPKMFSKFVFLRNSITNDLNYCKIFNYGDINELKLNCKNSENNDLKFINFQVFNEIEELVPIPILHIDDSHALVITRNGMKFVYSGDGRPSQELIKSGINAEILIHEATFDSNLSKNAIRTNHSTIEEALQVGKKMNARYILLTHFSNRLSFRNFIDYNAKNVCFANDLLTISPNGIDKIGFNSSLINQYFHENLNTKSDNKNKKNNNRRSNKKK